MMRAWVNILPLFIVRHLALRHGERFTYSYGEHRRTFAMATRDCFFKVDPRPAAQDGGSHGDA